MSMEHTVCHAWNTMAAQTGTGAAARQGRGLAV